MEFSLLNLYTQHEIAPLPTSSKQISFHVGQRFEQFAPVELTLPVAGQDNKYLQLSMKIRWRPTHLLPTKPRQTAP
jgi:hypothetical protein